MHLIWKYIIQDFLEIGCRLSPGEMKPLLEAYEEMRPLKKHLEVHPAFSLGNHMTVIVSKTTIKECRLYDPGTQRIQKIHLEDAAEKISPMIKLTEAAVGKRE